jgi:hypothetical protein
MDIDRLRTLHAPCSRLLNIGNPALKSSKALQLAHGIGLGYVSTIEYIRKVVLTRQGNLDRII